MFSSVTSARLMADKESRKVWAVEEVNTIFRLITGYSDDKERINTNVDLYGREEGLPKMDSPASNVRKAKTDRLVETANHHSK